MNLKISILLTFCITITFSDISFSQEHLATDSLIIELQNSAGLKRIEILNQLSASYGGEFPEKRKKYAEEALLLARSFGFRKGISLAQLNLGIGHYYSDDYDQSIRVLLTTIKPLTTLKLEAESGLANEYLGYSFQMIGKNDSSLYYLRKSLQNYKTVNDSDKIGALISEIGINYWNKGNFKTALNNFEEALRINRNLKLNRRIASVLNRIGSVHWKTGNYYKAFEYFEEAYEIRKNLGDETGMLISNNNMGTIYQKLGHYDKAAEYFRLSLQLAINQEYDFGISYTYYNFGLLHYDRKDFDSALIYFTNSYEISREILSQNLRAMNLVYMGKISEELGQFNKAAEYYQEAAVISEEIYDEYTSAIIQSNQARMLLESGKTDKALELVNMSQAFAGREKVIELLMDNHHLLYQIYLRKKNDLSALRNYKLYSEYRDSLYNTALLNNLGNMVIKHEIRKSDAEKEVLIKEKQLAVTEINYQKNLRNLFIALSVIILLGIVLLSYFFMYKNKTSEKIAEQNRSLEDLNQRLTENNQKLSEINKSKDKLLTIVAHDLRSPFQTLLASTEILSTEIENLSKEEISLYAAGVHENGLKMFVLLQDLLDWAYSQLQDMRPRKTEFKMAQVVDVVLENFKHFSESKGIQLTIGEFEDVTINADKRMIQSVLRNLVSNAIKFTNHGGQIEVSVTSDLTDCIVSVKDNGLGIPNGKLKNLFRQVAGASTGTANEVGTGLGLGFSAEMIQKNGGKIWVESVEGQGSVFYFSIPLLNNNESNVNN